MIRTLQIRLFGAPDIRLNDKPVEGFVTRKALALFIYIATDRRLHRRDKLASLFWGDTPEQQAKNNLRRVLPNLRQLVGSHLVIDRQAVLFDEHQPFISDVDVLRTALAGLPTTLSPGQEGILGVDPSHLENALALYQGDFLEGFYVDDAPAFEEWATLQREELRELACRGLTLLTTYYLAQNNDQAALAATQRLLQLDPWSETAHYQRMRLFARSGQRRDALAQYESYRAALVAEFHLQPAAAMTALYEQIGAETARRDQAPVAPALPFLPPPAHTVTPPMRESQPVFAQKIDWGEMPRPTFFAGRQTELHQLQRWLIDERCTLVALLGVGGAGKTALAAHLVRSLAAATANDHGGLPAPFAAGQPFRRIIWRSLLNAPPLAVILRMWLQSLSDHQLTAVPETLDEQLLLLFDYLRQERCLLILDNLESVMQQGVYAGHFLPEYQHYGLLLQRISEAEHQSCLVLTSREAPLLLTRFERNYPTVKSCQVSGLPPAPGLELLRMHGLRAAEPAMRALLERYSGNPLALGLVAETILDLYNGDPERVLGNSEFIFDDIRQVLAHQFDRLSPLERSILFWLSIERIPITLRQLQARFCDPPPERMLIEAMRSLQRRSLLEQAWRSALNHHLDEVAFTLQNVVMEYVTDTYTALISAEVSHDAFAYFHDHALLLAQALDYVRESQLRLLVRPVIQRLAQTIAVDKLPERLKSALAALPRHADPRPSYTAANVLHLALHAKIDLTGWDFAQLPIRQADLRHRQLAAINFSQAHFDQTAFMEKFNAILAVACSPDGRLVAASDTSGNIHIWQMLDYALIKSLPGNGRWIWALAFSPDGQMLASAGSDTCVHLWRADEFGQPLHAGENLAYEEVRLAAHRETIFSVAFSPDGQSLASAGADQTIRLWHIASQTVTQTLTGHSATVYGVAFSPDGQWLASASRDHTVRLWATDTGACRQVLAGHESEVFNLRFSTDGCWLVTASIDHLIQVWQMAPAPRTNAPIATHHHTLANADHPISVLALSPDGALLATDGPNTTIQLWQRATGRLYQTFHGHTEQIQSLAFHPNGKTLVSGSWDQTVRFWDVATGYPLRTLRGYTNAVNTLALSPDGQSLVSGNVDGQLCLWHWPAPALSQQVEGHSGAVQSVAFHPGGHLCASGGSDGVIRLWRLRAGQLQERQRLPGQRGGVLSLAFSPNGQFMASSSEDQTIQLWATHTGEQVQVWRGHTQAIQTLLFTPDSAFLLSGGEDGQIYRWAVADRPVPSQERLTALGVSQLLAAIPGQIMSMAFSPESCILAAAGADHTIYLWCMQRRELLFSVASPINSTVYALAFRPRQPKRNPQLVSSSGTGALCFWDIDLVTRSATLRTVGNDHKGSVRSIQFTPDGQTLISGGADETIKSWAAESGQCLATLALAQPYNRMNITGATGLTAAQRMALRALGAVAQRNFTPE